MFNLGNAEKNMLSIQHQNRYYNENTKVDINDTNDSHAIIAKNVKSGSVCLDVGCGPGYIGKLLQQEKNCKMYGIEIDEEAIKIAKKSECYQEIYNFSITDTSNKIYQEFFNNNLKFDYIIFADILEHLEEPEKVLKELSKKLKANGKFLISLPNIAHMDISKNLLERNFNYNITGLLDNTHIRFFTKKSFIQFIDNVNQCHRLNLHIKRIYKTIVVPPYASSYPNLYKVLNEDGELCVLQYIYEIENNKEQPQNPDLKDFQYFQEIELQLSERNAFLELIQQQEKEIEKLTQEKHKLESQIQQLLYDKKELILKNQRFTDK